MYIHRNDNDWYILITEHSKNINKTIYIKYFIYIVLFIKGFSNSSTRSNSTNVKSCSTRTEHNIIQFLLP